MHMIKHPAVLFFVSVFMVNLLMTNQSQAAGFSLITQNASGMGAAYSGGSAIADDASTVFFNPAGMIRLSGSQFLAASYIVSSQVKFKNQGSTAVLPLPGGAPLSGPDDNAGKTSLIANFYYTRPINDKLMFGFGINTPFGTNTSYDKNWVGRYHAVDTHLATINFNPSIAYKFNDKLSAGFGLNAQYIDATLSSAIDFGTLCFAVLPVATCTSLGTTPQQSDGFVNLTGNDISLGWNAGVLFQLNQSTRIGAAYRSQITHKLEGKADFTVPVAANAFVGPSGAFVDTGLTAEITVPQILSVSAFHEFNKKIDVMADVTWTGWDSFQEIRIKYDNSLQSDSVTTENFKNVFRYAVGMQYRLNDQWLLRTGLAYDETPVRSPELRTPRAPDQDRTWLSFGFSYVIQEKLQLDGGYTHIFTKDAKINNSLETSIPPLNATLSGEYETSADLLSAQLKWQF